MSHSKPASADAQCTVSVIVPTYNRPRLLREALQSILAQTYDDFEIVVVNDAGVDVKAIVAAFKKQKDIVYLRHATNHGLAATRNTGLNHARGKYVAYLDDDDTFLPNHLETLVRFLEGSDYKVAYTDAYRAHIDKALGEYVVAKRDVPFSSDFNHDRILIYNFAPVICFMHEKSCIDSVGYFDETLSVLEDWDFWIRMSQHFKVAHIKKLTCEVRWQEDGTTMSSNRADFIRTTEIIYNKYDTFSRMPIRGRWFRKRIVRSQKLKKLIYYYLRLKRRGYHTLAKEILKETTAT